MERVRAALAVIRADRSRAKEVLERGLREAPEVFIPGLAYFIGEALAGVVVAPENLPSDP
jgi:hypothetical protein